MKLNRSTILITLMLTGEIIFLLPFVVARIFRPTFLKVFEINNFELGSAFSVYGIVAMISYFAGGPIADKYSPRKLMIISLIITALGGVFMGMTPSLTGLTILYGFWGISTILLYWAAAVKATREFGGDESTQGRAFGLVDAGRGLIAAILASLSVLLFDAFLPVSAEMASLDQMSNGLSNIIFIFCGLIIASAVLVWFAFPNNNLNDSQGYLISFEGVKNVIKRPSIWLQALILLCGYVGYKCTDDFSLYASDVFGYDDVNAAHVGTISFWVRPVAALAAGLLGDRFGHSRMVNICFGIIIMGSLIISSDVLEVGLGLFIIMTIATTSAGIYGLRGLYFALFQESKIPMVFTGSAVGIVSVIGYTPDVFMGPLMGYVLDSSPGVVGHQHLFFILTGFGIVGLVASIVFKRAVKNSHEIE